MLGKIEVSIREGREGFIVTWDDMMVECDVPFTYANLCAAIRGLFLRAEARR